MAPVKTIVLATDFSEQSRAAEQHAIELARRCEATLHIVHGIEPIMGVEDEDSSEFDDFYQRLIDRAEAEMEKRIEAFDVHNLTVKQHIQIGPRWKIVLENAEEESADLIVLGRRSYTSDRRAPLGTTSQKIFYGSPRPVLFVPTDS
jgi:nucleotide-binding universal stress UspA family protein